MSFAVLVPAAGAGLRMGGGPRKQFRPLGDAPVLVQTLRAFTRHPDLGPLVVVAPPDEVATVTDLLAAFDLAALVVPGGPTRQASVGRGLDALPAETDLVLVHDAVRPFLAQAALNDVLAAARAHGAAALAIPVTDTLRQGSPTDATDPVGVFGATDPVGVFGATVPRDGLWRMQTPQAARAAWLRTAYATCGPLETTDEVALLQAAGFPVHIVEGRPENLKLTHPADWALAEALWAVWPR